MKPKKPKKKRGFLRRVLEALVGSAIVPAAVEPTAHAPAPPISQRVNKYSGMSAEEAAKTAKPMYIEDGDRVIQFAPRGWHAEESFATARTPYWKNPANRPQFTDVGKSTAQAEEKK